MRFLRPVSSEMCLMTYDDCFCGVVCVWLILISLLSRTPCVHNLKISRKMILHSPPFGPFRTGGLGNFKAPIHLTDATQCPLQFVSSLPFLPSKTKDYFRLGTDFESRLAQISNCWIGSRFCFNKLLEPETCFA